MLLDENKLLFVQNFNESRTNRLTVIGKATVISYEDIIEARESVISKKRTQAERLNEVTSIKCLRLSQWHPKGPKRTSQRLLNRDKCHVIGRLLLCVTILFILYSVVKGAI